MIAITPSSSPARQPAAPSVRPLGWAPSVLLTLVPALVLRGFIYGVMPAALAVMPAFDAFIFSFTLPLALLFSAALLAARRERNPLTPAFLVERFRFTRLSRRGWAIVALCFAIGFLGSGALGLTARFIASVPAFAPPAQFPAVIDPRSAPALSYATFMGQATLGNWRMIGLYAVMLFFNIAGEELWWRGYILPRQEARFGARAWMVHGLLWALFHAVFYPWQILGLAPLCFAISYAAQRTRSIWPGIVIHSLSNGLAMIPLLLGVLGVQA